MVTVEQNWETYRKLCWGHLNPDSVQMETIKQTFYAAWLDSMMTLQNLVGGDNVDEEKGAEMLGALVREVKGWLLKDIEKNKHKSKMAFITPKDQQ